MKSDLYSIHNSKFIFLLYFSFSLLSGIEKTDASSNETNLISNKIYFASKPDVPKLGDEYHQRFGRFDPETLESLVFREIEFGKKSF